MQAELLACVRGRQAAQFLDLCQQRTTRAHRTDDHARLLEVTWGVENQQQSYPVLVRIEAWDRLGLWRDISGAVADAGINIQEVQQVPTRKPDRAVLMTTLMIQSISQLSFILDKLNRLPDVIEARREHGALAASV